MGAENLLLIRENELGCPKGGSGLPLKSLQRGGGGGHEINRLDRLSVRIIELTIHLL